MYVSRCESHGVFLWQVADSEDGSDPEFSAGDESDATSSEEDSEDDGSEEESEEQAGAAGPSRMRRPKRVAQSSRWEARAAQEAEAMIAAAESSNKKAADVGQSVLHQVCLCEPHDVLFATLQCIIHCILCEFVDCRFC